VESVATMRAIIEAAEVWQNHNNKILGNNLFDILCAEQVRSTSPWPSLMLLIWSRGPG
jgi:hypothetical protein